MNELDFEKNKLKNVYLIFYNIVHEFYGVGHLNIVDNNLYNALLLYLPKNGDINLTNSNTKACYEYLESKFPTNNYYNKITEDNVKTEVLDENIAYVKINSFFGEAIEKDYNQLIEFYKKLLIYPI